MIVTSPIASEPLAAGSEGTVSGLAMDTPAHQPVVQRQSDETKRTAFIWSKWEARLSRQQSASTGARQAAPTEERRLSARNPSYWLRRLYFLRFPR